MMMSTSGSPLILDLVEGQPHSPPTVVDDKKTHTSTINHSAPTDASRPMPTTPLPTASTATSLPLTIQDPSESPAAAAPVANINSEANPTTVATPLETNSPPASPNTRMGSTNSTKQPLGLTLLPKPVTARKKMAKFTKRRCLEAATQHARTGGLPGTIKSICEPVSRSIYERKSQPPGGGGGAGGGGAVKADELLEETESEEEADHLSGGFGTCISTMREKVSRLRGMEGAFFMKVVNQTNTSNISDPLVSQFSKQKSFKMLYVRLVNCTQQSTSPSDGGGGSPTIRTYSPFGARVRGPTMYGGKKPPRGSMAAASSPPSSPLTSITKAVKTPPPSPPRGKGPPSKTMRKAPAQVAFKTPRGSSLSPPSSNRASPPHTRQQHQQQPIPPPPSSEGFLEIYDADVDLDAGEYMILDKILTVPLASINDIKRGALEQKDAVLMPSMEEEGCEYKYGQLLLRLSFTLPAVLTAKQPASSSPTKGGSGAAKDGTGSLPPGGAADAVDFESRRVKIPEFEVEFVTNSANERDLWYSWISKFILHGDMVDLHTDRQEKPLHYRAPRPNVRVLRPLINFFLRGAKRKAGGATDKDKASANGGLPKPPGDGLVIVYCEDVLAKRRLSCFRRGEVILSSIDNFSHIQKIVMPLRDAQIWVKNPFSNELYISFTPSIAETIDMQQNRAGMTTVDVTEDDAIELKATNPYERDVIVEWFLKVKGVPQSAKITYPYESNADEYRFTFNSVSPKRHRRRRNRVKNSDGSGSGDHPSVGGNVSDGSTSEDESTTSSGSDNNNNNNANGGDSEGGTRNNSPSLKPASSPKGIIPAGIPGMDSSAGGLWSPLDVATADIPLGVGGGSSTKAAKGTRGISRTKSKTASSTAAPRSHNGSFIANSSGTVLDMLPTSSDPRPLLDRRRLGRSASFVEPGSLSQSITGAKVADVAKEVLIRRRLSLVCRNRVFTSIPPPTTPDALFLNPVRDRRDPISKRRYGSENNSSLSIATQQQQHKQVSLGGGGKPIDINPLDAVDLLINPIVLHGRVQYGEIGSMVPLPTPHSPFFPYRVTTLDFAAEKVYVLEGSGGSTVDVELPVSNISCVTSYSAVFGSSGITLHCLDECIEICILFDCPSQRKRLLFALTALGVRCHPDKSREEVNRTFMAESVVQRARLDAKQGTDVAENTAMLYPCALCGKQSYVCDVTHHVHVGAVTRLHMIDEEQQAIRKRTLQANFEADFASSDDDDLPGPPPDIHRSLPSLGDWLFTSLPQLEIPNPRSVADLHSVIARSKEAIQRMEAAITAVS